MGTVPLASRASKAVAVVGYDESERIWEPATNITNAAKAISDFHKTFPSKPSLSSSAI